MDIQKRTSIAIFRERVATLIKENEMTQETFAEYCGLQKTDISNLSRKQAVPDDVMLAIADKCNVSTDWLLGRTDIREMARSKEESEKDFDYSKVTYGDLNRILAFAAACGVLQIVPPEDKHGEFSLLVLNTDTADFLRRLQKKAMDVISESDEAEYLADWFEKRCTIPTTLYTHDCVWDLIDKYHGAFPWVYPYSLDKNVIFDLTDAEWLPQKPRKDFVMHDPCDGGSEYAEYMQLHDGIVGYYDCDSTYYPKPPRLKATGIKDFNPADGFMNIPEGTDEGGDSELPFN